MECTLGSAIESETRLSTWYKDKRIGPDRSSFKELRSSLLARCVIYTEVTTEADGQAIELSPFIFNTDAGCGDTIRV